MRFIIFFQFFISVFPKAQDTGEINLTHEFLESKSIYKRKGDVFKLVNYRSLTNTKNIMIIGGKSSIRIDNNKVNEQKPVESPEDCSNLEILRLNGSDSEVHCLIKVDYKVSMPLIGIIKIKYKARAKFIEGNWNDYDNGLKVKIEPTKKGQNRLEKAFLEALKKISLAILEKNYSNILFTEESIESKGNSYFIGNRFKLVGTGVYAKYIIKALFNELR